MSFRLPVNYVHMRHSLVTSISSGGICIIAGIITVAIGLLNSAVQQGLVSAGGQLRTGDMAPISGFKSSMLRGGLTLFMWLGLLAVIFAVIEYLLGVYSSSHESIFSEKRWVANRFVWRLVVSFAFVYFVLILLPLIHWASGTEKNVVAGQSRPEVDVLLATLVWVAIYHALVVFLRLFTLRKAYMSLS